MRKGRCTTLRVALAVALALPCFTAVAIPVEVAAASNSGRIVFQAAKEGRSQIFTINPDGSDLTDISTDPTHNDWYPNWSPDGTKIVFSSNGDLDFRQLFVMNADGSGRTQITPDAPDVEDLEPCWSPDGTKIVFVAAGGASHGLWVVNADGSGRTLLLSGLYNWPDWSPDGTKIVFAAHGGGIYAVNSDDGAVTTLKGDGGYYPQWSPDGTKIAYADGGDIWVMDASGANQTRLVDEVDGSDSAPTWSRDGMRIAFSRGIDGTFGKIWTMNVDGSDQTQISFGVGESWPDWSWPPAAPGITCPSDMTVYAEDGECAAVVAFDVAATGFPFPTVACTPEPGSVFPLGTTAVTCTASNSAGADAVCSFFVTVTEDDAPTISDVSVSPSVIWPPDRRMVDVEVAYTAEDCSGEVACSLSVTSNELISGPGDPSPDWEVVDAHHVRLRAERARNGTGRLYTITIACRDADGNSLTQDVTVSVPRSQ